MDKSRSFFLNGLVKEILISLVLKNLFNSNKNLKEDIRAMSLILFEISGKKKGVKMLLLKKDIELFDPK